ncbi:hypothetical protein RJ639_028425 [Escallonia herrerae]|uniref:Succinate dehydrogenase subunit 6, mitochondrial n=1 Tax=Escallonia herrerae TaxID=1293975 RepID=A0AA88XJN5_9ASTE|nr:hypothetical protein RJ639_028425 [Escallonia herrerae]
MGEGGDSSSRTSPVGFIKKHYQGWKDFWADRFAFLDNYTRFAAREERLPPWSSADVEKFIAEDPVYGPTLNTAREAAKYATIGGAIGAVSTAAFAWKYSRSPHGAALSFGAGAVFGMTFGQEFANHWLQLYRLDTLTAQTKFMEWWEEKSEGR